MVEQLPFKQFVVGPIPTWPSVKVCSMRGKTYSSAIKQKCLKLRRRGYSLNEISSKLSIPKTTIHDWVNCRVILSLQAKKRIQDRVTQGSIKGNKSLNRSAVKQITEPKNWTPELVSIVGHFLFDGYSTTKKDGYVYCSRNISQINRMNNLMSRVFGLKPSIITDKNNVTKSQFFSVKLADLISKKKEEIVRFIPTATPNLKRAFLRAFFDDEGCVTFCKNKKQVRGYQHSFQILTIIQNLLDDFGIKGYIDKRKVEVTITGKENLIKFRNKINFSSNIFINPNRMNGLWKTKITKRAILEKAINSYIG